MGVSSNKIHFISLSDTQMLCENRTQTPGIFGHQPKPCRRLKNTNLIYKNSSIYYIIVTGRPCAVMNFYYYQKRDVQV